MSDPAARIREIEQRIEAATPGPWFDCLNDLIGGRVVSTVNLPASQARDAIDVADFVREENAAFIAHCRADVPWLLALLKEHEDGIADAYGELGSLRGRALQMASGLSEYEANEDAWPDSESRARHNRVAERLELWEAPEAPVVAEVSEA